MLNLRGAIIALSQCLFGRAEETAVRMSGVPTEIGTPDLQNKKQEYFPLDRDVRC